MNQRALVTLAMLLGAAYGKSPQTWLATMHRELRDLQSKEPANTVAVVVLLSAVLFYAAERGKNPKIESLYDALIYASTNISVGYSDVLARTSLGKVVGSLLMTYGPALATRALERPAAEQASAATERGLQSVADKLEEILSELIQQRVSSGVEN